MKLITPSRIAFSMFGLYTVVWLSYGALLADIFNNYKDLVYLVLALFTLYGLYRRIMLAQVVSLVWMMLVSFYGVTTLVELVQINLEYKHWIFDDVDFRAIVMTLSAVVAAACLLFVVFRRIVSNKVLT